MKQRTITAVVLIALLVPIVYIGGIPFSILIGVLSVMATYELLHICDRPKCKVYLYILISIYMLYILYFSSGILVDSSAIIILLLLLYVCSIFDETISLLRLGYYFSGAVLISVGLLSIYYLRMYYGFSYLVLLLFATLGADTGAYLFGKAFGKHKLIPRLSPNKTIEGSIGGIFLGSVLSIGYALIIDLSIALPQLVIICIILTMTGQIGDLTFSNMKRTFEVKDFSHLLPGHGGILDRFDALLFNGAVLGLLLSLVSVI